MMRKIHKTDSLRLVIDFKRKQAMVPLVKRERVDHLIDYLWKNGYMTLSRKYGKYLPDPPLLGEYEVDVVAKYRGNIAIGLIVSEEELKKHSFLSKLNFLSNYSERYANNRFTLFLGVQYKSLFKASLLISSLVIETQKHIKLITLSNSSSE